MLQIRSPSICGLIGGPMPAEVFSPNPMLLVKSGVRVLEIFEYFARVRRPSIGLEISNALGLPKASANDLLKTLVETGYLTFNRDTKSYFPTPRILRLGLSWSTADGSAPNVLTLMSELQKYFQECVALSVENDGQMQFVAFLPTPGVVLDHAYEGLKFRLLGSASGSAVLTTKSDVRIIELVQKIERLKPPRVREEVAREVIGNVRQFRKQGYAMSFRPQVKDGSAIAMILPNCPGNAPVALCVGARASRIAEEGHDMAKSMMKIVSRFMQESAHGNATNCGSGRLASRP